MVSLNSRIANDLVSLSVDLQRVEVSIRRKILSNLRGLEVELVRLLQEADLANNRRPSIKQQKLESLLKQVKETIRTSYRNNAKTLSSELLELADLSAMTGVKVINTSIGGSVFTTSLSRADLKAISSDAMINGNPVSEWWDSQSESLRKRFAQQVRQGMLIGETNDDIIRRVRGTFTGKWVSATDEDGNTTKVRQFSGGVMDITTRDASTLVRTGVQAVNNQVMQEVYEENSDILRGITAIVTLDTRTSEICIARSGGAWDMEGNPLPESTVQEPFPGYPPWHPNCRTVMAPLTKSWEQLIEEAPGNKTKVWEKSIPVSTQSSMDGEVPSSQHYPDWLEGQPVSVQQDKLGLGKWQLWNDGKLESLSQLLDQSGNPLSLKELRTRYS